MSNPHLAELRAKLQRRYSVERAGMTTSAWVEENTTKDGNPFNYNKFPFQRRLIDDWHARMVVRKCSQKGLTEIQIRKALAFLSRNDYRTLLFTFPDRDMLKKNAQTRIQPLLKDEVFNLDSNDNDVRRMELMSIAKSYLMVVPVLEGAATSTPADVVFSDEVDLSDQKMLALLNSRMQNSDLQINQRFSTPTFPGFGIDLDFHNSDQHVYMIRCGHCNHHQVPKFERNFIHIPGLPDSVQKLDEIDSHLVNSVLDLDSSYVCCEKCKRPLDLKNEFAAEWVPTYPSRTMIRGYDVSPFTGGNLSVKYIVNSLIEYKDREFLRGWYNTVLGLPYTNGNSQITLQQIMDARAGETEPEIGKDTPVSIGIDMGHTCHIVLGVTGLVFKWMTVHVDQLKDTVTELQKRYNIVCGLCDRHPLEPTTRAVRDASNWVVLPAEYRGEKEVNLIYDPEDVLRERVIHVQINRTNALDAVHSGFKNKTLKIAGYQGQFETISQHLQDMARIEEPEKPAKWIKLTGNDHYFHALGFMLTAARVQNLMHLQTEVPKTIFFIHDSETENQIEPYKLGDLRALKGETLWLR